MPETKPLLPLSVPPPDVCTADELQEALEDALAELQGRFDRELDGQSTAGFREDFRRLKQRFYDDNGGQPNFIGDVCARANRVVRHTPRGLVLGIRLKPRLYIASPYRLLAVQIDFEDNA